MTETKMRSSAGSALTAVDRHLGAALGEDTGAGRTARREASDASSAASGRVRSNESAAAAHVVLQPYRGRCRASSVTAQQLGEARGRRYRSRTDACALVQPIPTRHRRATTPAADHVAAGRRSTARPRRRRDPAQAVEQRDAQPRARPDRSSDDRSDADAVHAGRNACRSLTLVDPPPLDASRATCAVTSLPRSSAKLSPRRLRTSKTTAQRDRDAVELHREVSRPRATASAGASSGCSRSRVRRVRTVEPAEHLRRRMLVWPRWRSAAVARASPPCPQNWRRARLLAPGRTIGHAGRRRAPRARRRRPQLIARPCRVAGDRRDAMRGPAAASAVRFPA